MSSKVAIKAESLSKCYHIYDKPRDRLMQMVSRGTRQYYRQFWSLKDVSFEIERGETVGIVGRNGSGKSTLLQMICGTLTPTSGAVATNGRVAALLELGAGFNSEFTGRENVFLNASILGFPRDEIAARMDQIVAFSELGDFLDQPVKKYSSGMYARLAFSIAIHVDPEILVVDEALSVGDARFVAKCMRRIKEIQAKGTTLLFVSHDVGSVRTLCERAIWLDKGRLVEHGNVFPVTGRYMEYMFQDELTEDKAIRQEIVETAELRPGQREVACADSTRLESGEVDDAGVTPGIDRRPVTHWGSHRGIIKAAYVGNRSGERLDVLSWGAAFEVVIDLALPSTISREFLSVAFSIKDLKGTDLIVSTTRDFAAGVLPDADTIRVVFSLTNALVTGKYLLVAAVENRQHHDVHYYEYIEGVQYFSSLASERLYGIFHPEIEQTVMVK